MVPLSIKKFRPRYAPALRCTSAFPEINVRTYVKAGDRSGVWFFSLDATSRLAVRVARAWYGLPYYDARIRVDGVGESIRYHSRRVHRGALPAEFAASYRPTGPAYRSKGGTLEHWLTMQYGKPLVRPVRLE